MEIILPVYNGLQDLKRCVNSLLISKTRLSWHAFIIDDASSDSNVKVYLKALEENRQFTVIYNEENLGFVKTVNKGFSISTKDLVLLNSDTIVYDYWLDRITAHALVDERVATVTPLSNNATIASFPEFDAENTIAGFAGEQISATTQLVNSRQSVETPTGVGFCMFVSRKAITEVGQFDEENFGRGYGEENDFCLRAAKQGFIHLIACDAYVFHAGGKSFGSEKQARVAAAVKKLDELYPSYSRKVHEFLSLDPLREYRLRILLELSRLNQNATVLHICHNLGGGTLHHIRELSASLAQRSHHWILRVVGGNIIRLEWAMAASSFIDIDTENDKQFFWEILRHIAVSRIHVHHIASLPQEVFRFIESSGLAYDVTLHDYYFIGANPTLTAENGRHLGLDKPMSVSSLSPTKLAAWQQQTSSFLNAAKRVIYPSKATKEIYEKVYPEPNYQLAVHLDSVRDYPYPSVRVKAQEAVLKVLVLGALNREKGADVLEAVAQELSEKLNLEFVLLGYAYRRLHNAVNVLGGYDEKDVDKLLEQEDPDLIWLPALWPETYSYTLSAALRSAKPILAPQMGAFVERLADRPMTQLYDSLADKAVIIKTLLAFLDSLSPGDYSWQTQPAKAAFYENEYLNVEFGRLEAGQPSNIYEGLRQRLKVRLDAKERILSYLLGLRRYSLFRSLLRYLPVEQKIRVVRFFTNKNLLDIEKNPAHQ